jgi:hypothetical protein
MEPGCERESSPLNRWMTDRQARIAEARQAQSEEELERKWNKAQGRWTNRYWAQEWLDLAAHRATKLWTWMNKNSQIAGDNYDDPLMGGDSRNLDLGGGHLTDQRDSECQLHSRTGEARMSDKGKT